MATPNEPWAIGPVVRRADIPDLCEQLTARAQCEPDVVICDVGMIANPDMVTVEALAQIHLVAHRLGKRVRLHRPTPELLALIAFTGLMFETTPV